jgi:hypothetical protein
MTEIRNQPKGRISDQTLVLKIFDQGAPLNSTESRFAGKPSQVRFETYIKQPTPSNQEDTIMNGKRKQLGLTTAVFILLVAVLLFGGAGITAAAAQSAIPGDALYAVKTSIEQTRLSLAQDAGDRAQMKMAFAQRRLEEIAALIEEGRYRDVGEAVLSFEADIHSAILELETVSRGDPARAASIALEITEALTRYAQTLSIMAASVPESVRPEVARALDTTQIAGSLELPSGEDGPAGNENTNDQVDDDNGNDGANTNGDDRDSNENSNANGNEVDQNGNRNANSNSEDQNGNGDDRGGNATEDDRNENGNGSGNTNGDDHGGNGNDNGSSDDQGGNGNTNGDDQNGNVNTNDAGDDQGGNANTNGDDSAANDNDDGNQSIDNSNTNTSPDDNGNTDINGNVDDSQNGNTNGNSNDGSGSGGGNSNGGSDDSSGGGGHGGNDNSNGDD